MDYHQKKTIVLELSVQDVERLFAGFGDRCRAYKKRKDWQDIDETLTLGREISKVAESELGVTPGWFDRVIKSMEVI